MTRFQLPRWVDALFVLALAIYALAGVPIATFHGDEPMQIYMSSDYTTLFIDRAPERLITQPPYSIDSDPHLRILNGTINRYTIGFAWQLAGYTVNDLPPRPGWDWGLGYADNVATAHRPSPAQLDAARLPSALFFAASIGVLFLLAEQVGGRGAAYVATLVYALHPALLLNGRRALQEGAMLFFGLLALYAAIKVTGNRGQVTAGKVLSTKNASLPNSELRTQNSELIWALFTLACGLTLASKHSGIVFVAGALGGVFGSMIYRWVGSRLSVLGSQSARAANSQSASQNPEHRTLNIDPRTQNREPRTEYLMYAVRLLRTAILALLLFYALSPALWNDAVARAGDLLAVRGEMLSIQTAVSGGGMTLPQRVEQIVVQPFIAPLAHYEAAPFAEAAPIADEIARYMASPLSGVQFGSVGGALLTLLAWVGIGVCVLKLTPRPPLRVQRGGVGTQRVSDTEGVGTRYSASVNHIFPSGAIVLLVTLVVVIASLLANPLPWQRYYLPLMALMSVFAGVGVMAAVKVVGGRKTNV
jgi:hypothetical protein